MDITEVKGAINEGITQLKSQLDAKIAERDEKLGKYNERSEKLETEIKSLVDAQAELTDNLKDIAQKMTVAHDAGVKTSSWGEQFVNSAEFKSLSSGSAQKARFEVKTVSPASAPSIYAPTPNIRPGAFKALQLLDVIPQGATNGNMVTGVREDTFTNAANTVTQGSAKPQTTLSFAQVNVPIQTIAHYVKASSQLLQDSAAAATYIDTRLRYGLNLALENQVMTGNSAAPNLSGLTFSGNYTAYTPSANTDTVYDAIIHMKYTLMANGFQADTVVVNASDWATLLTVKGTDNVYAFGAPALASGVNPLGLRVVISPSISAGNIMVAQFETAAMLWKRQDATVELGYDGTDFTQNLITVRAEERVGLEVAIPSAILYGAIHA